MAERVTGIFPAVAVWEAIVRPMGEKVAGTERSVRVVAVVVAECHNVLKPATYCTVFDGGRPLRFARESDLHPGYQRGSWVVFLR